MLVDGYYFTVPAVTHKELLYALDAGARVIGAASLGALRAVELEPFGMTGVGEVFARYRSGEIDGDDEVALLHAPAENGYRPLTVALVEVRHALDRLELDGRRLIAELKAVSFLDRFPDRIAELARRHLGEEAAAALGRLLRAGGVKEADARLALEVALGEGLQGQQRRQGQKESPVPEVPAESLASPDRSAAISASTRRPTSSVLQAPRESPSLRQAWRMAQLFHPEAVDFVREIRRRSLRVAAAVRAGVEAPAAEVRRRAGELRRLHVDLWGRPFLPAPEYEEEARFQILAASLGAEADLGGLARELGLADGDEETLIHLAAGGGSAVPGWWLARAFCLRPAFPAAVETAVAAAEVHRCFLRWADGARVAGEDLRRLAAGLWGCAPGEVPREAARRGIFSSSLVADGLRDALETVAAAERLPRPINGYPEARDRLAGARLTVS